MEKKKVIYYSDELNDDFSGDKIKAKRIDKNYKYYSKSLLYKFLHFFYYRLIAVPLAYFYLKIKFHHKIINKKILKPFRNGGFFIYGNHTQNTGDAVIPTMIVSPLDAYLIVHANNVSMPVLGKITPYLGAIPLPDDFESTKNFIKAVEMRLSENHAIIIYPESHIWPYYTKIRNFTDKSFRYPVNLKKPSFCFVNTYQKRKRGKGVNLITYVEGPFFADESLPDKTAKAKLRDEIYNAMVKLSSNSNCVKIEYIKKETNSD